MLVLSHRCSLRIPSRHDSPADPAGWVAKRRRGRSQAQPVRTASFDSVVLGNQEADAWAAYHRHESGRFFVAAVGTVRAGFGMGTRG